MLVSIVNPYEFHARTIGVYAALVVSDMVVTALPTDGAGDTSALRPEDVPKTLETARAWGWSEALWREGVLRPGFDSASPLEDVERVCEEIEGVGAWAPIRPMIDRSLFDDARSRIESIARDLAHGGINPGVTIPVSCGVARFAGRHGLLLFRSPPHSTVTKLEAAGTTVDACCAVPVLEGVDGDMALVVRETLSGELARVRLAMVEVIETARSHGAEASDVRGVEHEVLQPATAALERSFADHRRVLVDEAEDRGQRCRVRMLTLSVGHADPDQVLHAATTAAMTLRGGRNRPAAREAPADAVGRRSLAVCGVGVRRLEAVAV